MARINLAKKKKNPANILSFKSRGGYNSWRDWSASILHLLFLQLYVDSFMTWLSFISALIIMFKLIAHNIEMFFFIKNFKIKVMIVASRISIRLVAQLQIVSKRRNTRNAKDKIDSRRILQSHSAHIGEQLCLHLFFSFQSIAKSYVLLYTSSILHA